MIRKLRIVALFFYVQFGEEREAQEARERYKPRKEEVIIQLSFTRPGSHNIYLANQINMSYKKAPTTQSKLSRITQFAPNIKNFYFHDGRNRSGEYEKFMREVALFTASGKNLHDDSVDGLAMLSDFIGNGVKCVSVGKRLF